MEEVTSKVASGKKVEEDNSYLYLVRIRIAILSGNSRFCRLLSPSSCQLGAGGARYKIFNTPNGG